MRMTSQKRNWANIYSEHPIQWYAKSGVRWNLLYPIRITIDKKNCKNCQNFYKFVKLLNWKWPLDAVQSCLFENPRLRPLLRPRDECQSRWCDLRSQRSNLRPESPTWSRSQKLEDRNSSPENRFRRKTLKKSTSSCREKTSTFRSLRLLWDQWRGKF